MLWHSSSTRSRWSIYNHHSDSSAMRDFGHRQATDHRYDRLKLVFKSTNGTLYPAGGKFSIARQFPNPAADTSREEDIELIRLDLVTHNQVLYGWFHVQLFFLKDISVNYGSRTSQKNEKIFWHESNSDTRAILTRELSSRTILEDLAMMPTLQDSIFSISYPIGTPWAARSTRRITAKHQACTFLHFPFSDLNFLSHRCDAG